MDRDRILLTPGPLTTTLRTKLAMLKDWGSWDADFNAINAGLRHRLLDIVRGHDSHAAGAAARQRHVQRRGRGGHAGAQERPCAGARQRRLLQTRRQADADDGPQVHRDAVRRRRAGVGGRHRRAAEERSVGDPRGAGALRNRHRCREPAGRDRRSLRAPRQRADRRCDVEFRCAADRRPHHPLRCTGCRQRQVPRRCARHGLRVPAQGRCSTPARATARAWRWTCTTSTSTWKRPASGASRRPRTWWWRWPKR